MITNSKSNDEYHSHSAISHSGIMAYLQNPQKYYENYILGNREVTKPMEIGTLVHESILEPDKFNDHYIVMPEFSGKGSRSEKQEWLDIMKGHDKIIIDKDTLEMITLIRNNFNKSSYLKSYLENGQVEHSLFWKNKINGFEVEFKSRPDFIANDILFDIKTTKSIESYEFSKAIHQYGYHVQAAMAIDGMGETFNGEKNDFVIVAFEKIYPYVMSTFMIDSESLDIGRELYKKTALEIHQTNLHGLWESPNMIGIPQYAKGDNNYE